MRETGRIVRTTTQRQSENVSVFDIRHIRHSSLPTGDSGSVYYRIQIVSKLHFVAESVYTLVKRRHADYSLLSGTR